MNTNDIALPTQSDYSAPSNEWMLDANGTNVEQTLNRNECGFKAQAIICARLYGKLFRICLNMMSKFGLFLCIGNNIVWKTRQWPLDKVSSIAGKREVSFTTWPRPQ